jgi:transcriptional regulator
MCLPHRQVQGCRHGVSDQRDQQAAQFIEKARKTVSKMNDKRAPVTKLFDEIRRQFTIMENEVDPSKNGGICVLYMAKVDTEKYCKNCMAYHNKNKDNNDNTQS